MTTLHYVLMALAVLLVGGVALYNVWQERRLRRQVDQMFAAKREEVALTGVGLPEDTADIEPVLRLSDAADPAGPKEEGAQQEEREMPFMRPSLHLEEPVAAEPAPTPTPAAAGGPVSSPLSAKPAVRIEIESPPGFAASPAKAEPAARPAAAPPAAPSATPRPAAGVAIGARLDPGTEYIARLRFGQAEPNAFAGLLARLRALGKPVRAIGQRADGVWEELGPRPAAAYAVVELGLQLADRSGPVTEAQLDAFCQALYAFATKHGGAVSCPEKRAALELARELDQFCIEVDVLIGLNLVSPDDAPFNGKDILRLAAEAGMQPSEEGSYVLRDAAGRVLFSLVNQEDRPFPREEAFSTHGVTLLFDVPRVADGLAVFDRMTRLGFDLAARLSGRLVDDRGRAVTQESLSKDRQRLDAFYARMIARDIPPGGERAMRLFA